MKLNAKYVVFSLIAVASVYVLYHNERFLVDSTNPVWQHGTRRVRSAAETASKQRNRPAFPV